MAKKDIEISVEDTDTGVLLRVGKKTIGAVNESDGDFEAVSGNNRSLGSYKTYEAAEEEVIKAYNLAV